MSIKQELMFIAEYFTGEHREQLEEIANKGNDNRIKSAIYEAEQKLDGRSM